MDLPVGAPEPVGPGRRVLAVRRHHVVPPRSAVLRLLRAHRQWRRHRGPRTAATVSDLVSRPRPDRVRLRRHRHDAALDRRRRSLRPDDARRRRAGAARRHDPRRQHRHARPQLVAAARTLEGRPHRLLQRGHPRRRVPRQLRVGHAGRDERPRARGLPLARRTACGDRRRHPRARARSRARLPATHRRGRRRRGRPAPPCRGRGAEPNGDADPRSPRGLLDDARAAGTSTASTPGATTRTRGRSTAGPHSAERTRTETPR